MNNRNILQNQYKTVRLKQHNKISSFELRRLFPGNLQDVAEFQKNILCSLEDKNLLVESTESEILESMFLDFCYGLYDGEKNLIAFCIIVLNRKTERSLSREFQKYTDMIIDWNNSLTFDTIQVKEEFRGYGIHRLFLQIAERIANMQQTDYILATASPKNMYSINNFEKENYKVKGIFDIEKEPYNGKKRCLLVKTI